MKGADQKIGSTAAQNNLQDLHKDTKENIPKESTLYFLPILTNYQIIRNRPIFTYVPSFDHKKKIITMYDSPPASI